jgi:serine protease Do
MNRTTSKHSTIFILLVLTAVMLFASSATAVQVKGSHEQASAESFSWNNIDQEFHKAHDNFLRKDFKDAAREIRQGVALFKRDADQATGEGKQQLEASIKDLNELADRVDKGVVTSVNELDQSFVRADHALSKNYHLKSSESWNKRDLSEAGKDLKAAASTLERTLAWAGHRWEAGTEAAIKEAMKTGEKLEKETGWVASEVKKDIDALGREIENAGHKIAALSSSASSIQISEKTAGPVDLTTAISQVAHQNLPAVVYIEVTESQEVQNPYWQYEQDPSFRRFFGLPRMPRKFKQQVHGLGSGMIIDAQGHILTNYHVAGGATKLTVGLADGSKYEAKLVGGDAKTDLAVIQIQAGRALPHVTFGDSDKVTVGEWVVAIGAPRALEKSVTQGIISALHRTGITEPSSYEDFLQTDAAINPGNSGGPLLNLHGQVIGVNAAIATQSGGFEGIGFTVPSNMAVYIANAVIAHGKVERGWLGVSIRNLTPELATTVHAPTTQGALIVDVVKGGPAEKAGIRKNDVIVAFDGREVPDAARFRNDVAQTTVGHDANITFLRNGKREEARVRTENMEEATKVMAGSVKVRLGVEVRPTTPKEVEKYGLKENEGVVITRLDPKSPLAKAGFEVGDMVLAIDDHPVEGVEGFANLIILLKPNQKISILALDHRTGNTGTISVTV